MSHTHREREEYYSARKRNEIGTFAEKQIDLESVVQSEVSQKNKYCILMQICGIQEKMLEMNYLQGRKRDADEENGHVDTVGGRGQQDELRDQD